MEKTHKSATQNVSKEIKIEQPPKSQTRTNVYPFGYWIFWNYWHGQKRIDSPDKINTFT